VGRDAAAALEAFADLAPWLAQRSFEVEDESDARLVATWLADRAGYTGCFAATQGRTTTYLAVQLTGPQGLGQGQKLWCSGCGTMQRAAKRIIAGPGGISLCDGCGETLAAILGEDTAAPSDASPLPVGAWPTLRYCVFCGEARPNRARTASRARRASACTTHVNHVLITGQSLSNGYNSAALSNMPLYTHVRFNTCVRAGGVGLTGFVPLVETWDGKHGETIASGLSNQAASLWEAAGYTRPDMLVSAHGVDGPATSSSRRGRRRTRPGWRRSPRGLQGGRASRNARRRTHLTERTVFQTRVPRIQCSSSPFA
jgi:hypothetical protein